MRSFSSAFSASSAATRPLRDSVTERVPARAQAWGARPPVHRPQAAQPVLLNRVVSAVELRKKLRVLGDVAVKDRHAGGAHQLLFPSEMGARLVFDFQKQLGQSSVARLPYREQQLREMGVIPVHEGNAECGNGHERESGGTYRGVN